MRQSRETGNHMPLLRQRILNNRLSGQEEEK